jgi:putative transcriptional regulator
MDYAAGTLPEAQALVVATHLALCPPCRAEVRRLESLGGALIDDAAPEPLAPGALDAVLAGLDTPAPVAPAAVPSPVTRTSGTAEPILPQPLRDYMGGDADSLRWRWGGPGIKQVKLRLGPARRDEVKLLRVRPGGAIATHSHRGTEMTLVLQGGFTDTTGQFLRGDAVVRGPEDLHRPVADADGECLCLTVMDALPRFSGLFGRLMDLFTRP